MDKHCCKKHTKENHEIRPLRKRKTSPVSLCQEKRKTCHIRQDKQNTWPACQEQNTPIVYVERPNTQSIYGEFIRTFTFSGQPQLPIVQPGGSLVFPIPTVPPSGVTYVEGNRVGLLVPNGVYLVSWTLNPSEGATVDLLINGTRPTTPTMFPYGESITTDVLDVSYLVNAPLPNNNLISLVNGGPTLFTLNDIPNTKIGPTSVITHIRVLRLG